MTRYEVYNAIAQTLARDDVERLIQHKAGGEQVQQAVLEVINALNFCIRYNWPINTYFKERQQVHE